MSLSLARAERNLDWDRVEHLEKKLVDETSLYNITEIDQDK